MQLTSLFAALIAVCTSVRLFDGSPAAVFVVTVAASICAPLIQEALLHAEGYPALQALACTVLLVCALVAALTRSIVGAYAAVASVPAVAAGEHGGTACRSIDN